MYACVRTCMLERVLVYTFTDLGILSESKSLVSMNIFRGFYINLSYVHVRG